MGIELKDIFKEEVSDLSCERLEQLANDLRFCLGWTYRNMPKTQFNKHVDRLLEINRELTSREFISPILFGVGHE